MDTENQQPMDTGTRSTGNYSWRAIAAHLTVIEGHSVTHQSACESGKRLLKRLRSRLLEIPEVREWLKEQGIDVEDTNAHNNN